MPRCTGGAREDSVRRWQRFWFLDLHLFVATDWISFARFRTKDFRAARLAAIPLPKFTHRSSLHCSKKPTSSTPRVDRSSRASRFLLGSQRTLHRISCRHIFYRPGLPFFQSSLTEIKACRIPREASSSGPCPSGFGVTHPQTRQIWAV